MNRLIIYTFLVLILVGVGLFQYKEAPSIKPPTISSDAAQTTMAPEYVNYQANFIIFTNGLKRDFSAEMYHNLSEDVFITKADPTRIYIKKRGITWNMFFSSLPFTLTKECLTTGLKETFCSGENGTLRFFLNGVEDKNLLDKPIQDEDQVVITFGKETDFRIQEQLNQF